MKIYSAQLRLVPLVVAMIASGCAASLPTSQMEAARSSIRNAERANAGLYAPELLSSATDKMAKADVLMNAKRNKRAKRLIELAEAEALLAEAVSEAAHSEAAISSLKDAQPASTPKIAAALGRAAGAKTSMPMPTVGEPAPAASQPVVYTNKFDE